MLLYINIAVSIATIIGAIVAIRLGFRQIKTKEQHMLKEQFENVISEGWTTSGKNVQYKVVDGVLYFQCSDGESDWRYNFKFAEQVYSKSDIKFEGHKGFNELWLSVKDEIEKLDFDYIVGYSQGGALAERAHENYYHRKGYEPIQTVTFGCPASIHAPSKELQERFYNLINVTTPWDIVYFSTLVLGNKHVGSTKRLPYVAKEKKWELYRYLSGHAPEVYLKAIGSA